MFFVLEKDEKQMRRETNLPSVRCSRLEHTSGRQKKKTRPRHPDSHMSLLNARFEKSLPFLNFILIFTSQGGVEGMVV